MLLGRWSKVLSAAPVPMPVISVQSGSKVALLSSCSSRYASVAAGLPRNPAPSSLRGGGLLHKSAVEHANQTFDPCKELLWGNHNLSYSDYQGASPTSIVAHGTPQAIDLSRAIAGPSAKIHDTFRIEGTDTPIQEVQERAIRDGALPDLFGRPLGMRSRNRVPTFAGMVKQSVDTANHWLVGRPLGPRV